jgi:hypothetical protein
VDPEARHSGSYELGIFGSRLAKEGAGLLYTVDMVVGSLNNKWTESSYQIIANL